MTLEEFLDRIDEIMCGTSNAEMAYLEDLYNEVVAPHWISVEDELPEYDQRVLWCWDDGLISIGRVALDEKHIEAGYITHWMPLPSVEHLKDK